MLAILNSLNAHNFPIQQSGNTSTCWLETESNTDLCLRGSCICSGETAWLARAFPDCMCQNLM